MTTPEIETEVSASDANTEEEERKRRRLLLILLLLLLACCILGFFIINYLRNPQPLPDMLPQPVSDTINYPPTYKFSMTGLDGPVGVAVSPDGQRIYGTESAGQKLIKMFDRDGNLVKSFAPPGTSASNRSLTYIAVDASGRVFVVDIYNNVIAIFDADGNFLDGIISKDATLSKMITANYGSSIPQGTLFYYSNVSKTVDYMLPGQNAKSIPGPNQTDWSPLGIRFDAKGNLLVTNIVSGKHEVLIYPAESLTGVLANFNPYVTSFGVEGNLDGQLSFPNNVVTDSKGNYYVSDGNNARITAWGSDLQYKTFFGFGSTVGAVDLPRGMWMDSKDRLHVVDAVGQYVRVYDVSGDEPAFLFNFGEYGVAEGEFNFPIDICMDGTGRLYIADRENNRIQVWSY